MKKPIIQILFLFTSFSVSYSQTDDSLYFPLAVGNKWIYEVNNSGGFPPQHFRIVSEVASTSVLNGQQYFKCIKLIECDSISYIRYNRSSGFLVRYDSLANNCNYERELYKLIANPGDTINDLCTSISYECSLVQDTVLFGIATTLKSLGFEIYGEYQIAVKHANFLKKIGFYQLQSLSGHSTVHSSTWQLKGYVINNIPYGDTNSTTDATTHTQMINSFSLMQNYPNPFNPITSITFDVITSGIIKITVYDINGNKINEIADGYYPTGHYKIDWDGSDFATGIYFYKMERNNFSVTKKMLLIK